MMPWTEKGLRSPLSFKIPSHIHCPAEAQASKCCWAPQEGNKCSPRFYFSFLFDRPHSGWPEHSTNSGYCSILSKWGTKQRWVWLLARRKASAGFTTAQPHEKVSKAVGLSIKTELTKKGKSDDWWYHSIQSVACSHLSLYYFILLHSSLFVKT